MLGFFIAILIIVCYTSKYKERQGILVLKNTDVFKGLNTEGEYIPMTLEDINQSGVSSFNQPYELPELGSAIEDITMGYVLLDKNNKTYLPEGLSKMAIWWYGIQAYPVYVALNHNNFGYHYEVRKENPVPIK